MNKRYGRFHVPEEGYKTRPEWYEGIKKGIIELQEMFPDQELDIYIGTDSNKNKPCVIYTTAVIVHMRGKGGRAYFTNALEPHLKGFKNKKAYAKHRLRIEQYKSIEIATDLMPIFAEFGLKPNDIEVHADVNRKKEHLSAEVVAEVCGYIAAHGFIPNPKPDSFAATNVADDIARKFNWRPHIRKSGRRWIILKGE